MGALGSPRERRRARVQAAARLFPMPPGDASVTAMAIRELSASLEHDPSDPVTHLWIGDAYRRKAQSEP